MQALQSLPSCFDAACALLCTRPSLHSFAAAALNREGPRPGRGITRQEVKARLLHELSDMATHLEPGEACRHIPESRVQSLINICLSNRTLVWTTRA